MSLHILKKSQRVYSALLRTQPVAPTVLVGSLQQCRGFARGVSRDTDKTVTSRLTGKKTNLWDLYNEVVYPPRETEVQSVDGEIVEKLTFTEPYLNNTLKAKKI